MRWLATVFLVALATNAYAQPVKPGMGGTGCGSPTTIAAHAGVFNDLADFAKAGAHCMVTDALSSADCALGGGSSHHLCCYDGTTWSVAACGGGGGGNVSSVSIDNICINSFGGELFHDTNCNGMKDSGEHYIDERGSVTKNLAGATAFDGIVTHYVGLLPTPADTTSDNSVLIFVPGYAFPWVLVNSCAGMPAQSFTISASDYVTVDFCTAPPAPGAYTYAIYTEAE